MQQRLLNCMNGSLVPISSALWQELPVVQSEAWKPLWF